MGGLGESDQALLKSKETRSDGTRCYGAQMFTLNRDLGRFCPGAIEGSWRARVGNMGAYLMLMCARLACSMKRGNFSNGLPSRISCVCRDDMYVTCRVLWGTAALWVTPSAVTL